MFHYCRGAYAPERLYVRDQNKFSFFITIQICTYYLYLSKKHECILQLSLYAILRFFGSGSMLLTDSNETMPGKQRANM